MKLAEDGAEDEETMEEVRRDNGVAANMNIQGAC